jgi:uncharacterized membrane protein YdfJ with MMPL/SSD domain
MRRPVVWLMVAVVTLLVVAAPAVVMKKGNNTASAAHLPKSEYAKQGWDILDLDFSLGKANPLLIVVDGQVTRQTSSRHSAACRQRLRPTGVSALRRSPPTGPAT